MRRPSRTQFATLAALATLLAAAPAWAQEEGVTLDPSDPAAKEYALPYEQARREAAGDGDQAVVQGSRASGAFGEGVTPDAEKRETTDDAPADASATTPPAGGSGGTGTGAGSTETTASTGLSSTTALVGGGLLALVAAGLGGVALRAVRGPADA